MSKKKSYMDKENIINEGILSYTMDKIYKLFYLNPALKKNKKIKKGLEKLNKDVSNIEKMLNAELKQIGSKEKVKIKPYTAKDILSGRK
jgi:lysine/ornithine N-monooxygenase